MFKSLYYVTGHNINRIFIIKIYFGIAVNPAIALAYNGVVDVGSLVSMMCLFTTLKISSQGFSSGE